MPAMEAFMQFWENIAPWQRMAILLGGMVLFWLIEGYYPLFTFSWKRYKHASVNLVFLATTVILNIVLGAITCYTEYCFRRYYHSRVQMGYRSSIRVALFAQPALVGQYYSCIAVYGFLCPVCAALYDA
jgi:hypothetical protein